MTAPQRDLFESHGGPSDELKARIQAIAHEMLLAAKRHGVGFDDVRAEAEKRGLLTGEESGRFLSFGSPCMKAAGGIVAKFRRSKHKRSQRRRVAVYIHTSYAEGHGAADEGTDESPLLSPVDGT